MKQEAGGRLPGFGHSARALPGRHHAGRRGQHAWLTCSARCSARETDTRAGQWGSE